MKKLDPDLMPKVTSGYIWTHEQIVEIAGLIALRDLCLPGEAVRSLYSLMGEGCLPAFSEALRNVRRASKLDTTLDGDITNIKNLRGHGPANRARRDKHEGTDDTGKSPL